MNDEESLSLDIEKQSAHIDSLLVRRELDDNDCQRADTERRLKVAADKYQSLVERYEKEYGGVYA